MVHRIGIAGILIGLVVLAVVSPAQAALATTKLAPVSYITTSGGSGGQPVKNLAVQDQSGTQSSRDRYVEFTTPAGVRYQGYRRYVVPSTIPVAAIKSLQVKANYKGPVKAQQTWTWKIYRWPTATWVTLGTNAAAPSGSWRLLTFSATGTLASYVKTDTREIRVRLESSNAVNDADLDYEAVIVTANVAAAPPPPPPLPRPAPTPPPPTSGIWQPDLNTSWQWQLTGVVDQSVDAQMFDLDLFDTDASLVTSLHLRGKKVVCYLSAGSWEDWRPDAASFPASVKGHSNGWPGERWLDIRRIDILGPIMEARLDLCKAKGFDAVEPDNIDGYTNSTGFPLTYQDQLRYNIFLATAAHARGLSIGLKNDLDQIKDLLPYFDWALNEQCFQYRECGALSSFVNAGKAVFTVEYGLSTSEFCPQANALNFNSLKKNLNLDADRVACR
jgi:hypothetical protein